MANKNTASFNEIIELGEKARTKIIIAILMSFNDEDVNRFLMVTNEFFDHLENGKERREFIFNILCSANFLLGVKEEMNQSMNEKLLRRIGVESSSLLELLSSLSGCKE